MSTSHTPGPWKSDRRQILVSERDGATCIAEVFSGPCKSLEEADANGLLIAAAPDLLDVLKRLVLTYDLSPSSTIWNVVNAAIEKAEGK